MTSNYDPQNPNNQYQPQYPPPPPSAPAGRPWWRRAWLAAVVTGLIGLIIGVTTSGGSSANKTAAADAATTTTTATATVTSTATPVAPAVTRTVTGHPTKVIATHTQTRTVTYTPPPKAAFGDGQYLVPQDLKPGYYQTAGGDCYYEIDRNLHGGIESIIVNDNITGPTTVQITSAARAFKTSGGCDWRKR